MLCVCMTITQRAIKYCKQFSIHNYRTEQAQVYYGSYMLCWLILLLCAHIQIFFYILIPLWNSKRKLLKEHRKKATFDFPSLSSWRLKNDQFRLMAAIREEAVRRGHLQLNSTYINQLSQCMMGGKVESNKPPAAKLKCGVMVQMGKWGDADYSKLPE